MDGDEMKEYRRWFGDGLESFLGLEVCSAVFLLFGGLGCRVRILL